MTHIFSGLVLVDTGRQRRPKVNNPDGLAIRIFSNGQVYPSQELVDKFNLEYKNKPNAGEEQSYDEGFGFDVVDSMEWEPTKNYPRAILLGHTAKGNPKVDLFAITRYRPDGTPGASVMDQGTVSTTLLDLVRQLGYLDPSQKYCDLVIVDVDKPITTQDGLSFIPKVIERGDRKGQRDSQRRENSKYYVVVPAEQVPSAVQEEQSTVNI